MRRILSFKHWQLFLLIPIAAAWTSPSPLKEIINSISLITFTIWVYAVCIYGQEKIIELGLPTLNLRLFKINIIVLPILIILIYIFAPDKPSGELNPLTIFLILICFYFIFSFFQVVILASKTLVTLELKREVTFNDYFSTFLLMLFSIVGVWILQPKITRLIANNNELMPAA